MARDLDVPAIVACAVTPANRPEGEGAAPIAEDIERQGFRIEEAHIDRAYVNSPVITATVARGGTVFAKPWAQRASRPGLLPRGPSHDRHLDRFGERRDQMRRVFD